jgi:hypothetical protein
MPSKPSNTPPADTSKDTAPAAAPAAPAPEAAKEPTAPEVPEASTAPEPDEFGRYRVRDLDTGHVRSIHTAELPHGRYEVLDEEATGPTGLPVPPEHNRFPVEPITSGQEAENKENDHA